MGSIFKEFPLFNDLSEDILEIIKPLFELCTCHEGVIFKQGDPAIYLYLVHKGYVDILYKPYDAPEIAITSVRAGGIFGWSAIAGNRLYTSGAACKAECEAVRIQGDDLRELCVQHPQAGEILLDRLAESVSSRWKNAHSQVRDILEQGVLAHLPQA